MTEQVPQTVPSRLRQLYGAHPLHLAGVALLLLVAAVAGNRMLHAAYGSPRRVGQWLILGAIVHDMLLLPAYVAADAAVLALWRRRPGRVSWINHVRVPAGISLTLLLIYASEILRLNTVQFDYSTSHSDSPYRSRWLVLTGLLFGLSAAWYLARVGRTAIRDRRPAAR